MSVQGIRDAIQTGLATISGLRALDNVPESVNEVPCAFVIPRRGDYDFSAGGSSYNLDFEVVLLLARQGDVTEVQNDLDDYIAPTGSKSIKAAIEAADFGSHADAVRVTGFHDYGGIEFTGAVYLGVKFDMQAWV